MHLTDIAGKYRLAFSASVVKPTTCFFTTRSVVLLFAWICLALASGGCTPAFNQKDDHPQNAGLRYAAHPDNISYSAVLESSYLAADKLAHALRSRHFPPDTPIMAASFANIDNLTSSSTFGRIVSEQVANRLAQHGFKIVEMKLRHESVFMKKGEGEFMLSRELKDLSSSHEIQAALVGTYAISEYFVFVSARIVQTSESSVLAGCDYEVPNDTVTQSLLN